LRDSGEAGGDESQEIQFALGENEIKVLTMTVHDEIVFDNQSHKLFIISAASGIGFITFIRKVMKTKIILMILFILSN